MHRSFLLVVVLLFPSTLSFYSPPPPLPSLATILNLHHVCHKTSSLSSTTSFYSLFNYTLSSSFRTSGAKCAWLKNEGEEDSPVIELIEIPKEFGNNIEEGGTLTERPLVTGLNHIAFLSPSPLSSYLPLLSSISETLFNKKIKILQEPIQKQINREIWEMCFIEGPDSVIVELMFRCGVLDEGIGIE
ncbi:hypothetical protein TrLO_g12783 [Triparma laevis f. longispina]|uniref:Uncharacterized protein n=1 Tax=Triparma laevis f. longispina TaxID=1714387 RepID=A0A9W7DX81_9STRA|nr:hypothetical protein TrLO_g12783 [Triparma laevis f. longispina]